jgi:hypothetical protein
MGETWSLGLRVVARCASGREDGPSSRSSRECTYRRELDLETLVCTRARAFPLSRLESRLRCPRCGNRRMVVMFEPPSTRKCPRHFERRGVNNKGRAAARVGRRRQ